jgi:hypothetical protein
MLAALLLALGPASAPAATIADVLARPARYAGKRVVLRGWVSRCVPMDCAIAEAAGGGQRLSLEASARIDAVLAPLTPTWIELEARVDPTCITGLCTDRAPHLRDVTLRSIIPAAPPEN